MAIEDVRAFEPKDVEREKVEAAVKARSTSDYERLEHLSNEMTEALNQFNQAAVRFTSARNAYMELHGEIICIDAQKAETFVKIMEQYDLRNVPVPESKAW